MSNRINNLYEFGEFRIDTDERVLLRENETIILAAKVFDTLELLVKNQGKIVSKDEIMDEVWADSFVEEGNLTQNIYLLRKTLGKELIETVPRRGYRFTAPVKISSITKQTVVESNPNADLIVATKTKTHIIEEVETDFEDSNKNLALTEANRSNWFTSKALFATGLLIASIFVLGFIGYKYVQNTAENDNSSNILSDIEFEKLTETGDAYSPVISPDGKFMAYVKRESGEQTLHLKDMKSRNDVELQVENDYKIEYIQFSPTGEKLYFRTAGRLDGSNKIYEMSYFGGNAKLVAENVWGNFSVSPDGKKLAFYRGKPVENKQSITVKNLETNEEKEIADLTTPNEFFITASPAWTADGQNIAYVPVKEKSNRSDIVFVNLETGEEKTITTELTYIRQIAFLPDNKNLLLVSRNKSFQIFKLNYTNGNYSRITNDLNNYRNISITADGSKLITQQRKLKSDIWLYSDADINQSKQLTKAGYYGLYDLDFTRNGDVIYDKKGKISRDLEIVKTETLAKQTLSRDENTINNHTPVSDQNGRIYFVSDQSGSLNIWRINSDGTNPKQITFGKKGELNIAPNISPDDEWLYFIQKIGESNCIWKKSLVEETEAKKIYDAKDFSFGRFLSISPDNKWLAFHYLKTSVDKDIPNSNNSGQQKFGFLNLSDNKELKRFDVPTSRKIIRWTNGGKSFDYYQNKQRIGKIQRQDFNNNLAPPKLVFQIPQTRIMHFDWSPDEKDLVITKATNLSDAVLLKLAN